MKIEKDGKTLYVCECGKEFNNRHSFIGHCSRCEKHLGHKPTNGHNLDSYNNSYVKGTKSKFKDKNYNDSGKCMYCGKKYKNQNALTQHEIRCKKNPNHINMSGECNPKFGTPAWNKGLTKEEDSRLLEVSKKTSRTQKRRYKKLLKLGIKKKQPKWVKDKISESMLGKNNERNNIKGYAKCGYYKGIWCASSYELAFLIYCLDNNIKIERNEKGYPYKYKGKDHRYFPDFIIDNKQLIEIKGQKSRLVNIKMKCVNDLPIKVLYKNDLTEVFDYIYLTYNKRGVEVIELYDDYKVRYKKVNGKYVKKKVKKVK